MADDVKRLRHTADEIDTAIDILLEVYTRGETDTKFAEISAKISEIEERLGAIEEGKKWKWIKL